MILQSIQLRESCRAKVTLVRFVPSVNPEVTLKLECVRTSIRALRTLKRLFATVGSHVALQLAELDG